MVFFPILRKELYDMDDLGWYLWIAYRIYDFMFVLSFLELFNTVLVAMV